MDIGASTGGFTDCMLQNGARKVYAVDVGYGQLDYKLRTDPRVVNMEKCNIRYLNTDEIPDRIDFISIDVSFISLKLVLPVASRLLHEDGKLVCLVKPQFEAEYIVVLTVHCPSPACRNGRASSAYRQETALQDLRHPRLLCIFNPCDLLVLQACVSHFQFQPT